MKVTIINGNMRHGSTWHCVQEIVESLQKREQLDVTEFFLPRDLPQFCNGCFSCIYNGETTCPHSQSVAPILQALLDADLIVLGHRPKSALARWWQGGSVDGELVNHAPCSILVAVNPR